MLHTQHVNRLLRPLSEPRYKGCSRYLSAERLHGPLRTKGLHRWHLDGRLLSTGLARCMLLNMFWDGFSGKGFEAQVPVRFRSDVVVYCSEPMDGREQSGQEARGG